MIRMCPTVIGSANDWLSLVGLSSSAKRQQDSSKFWRGMVNYLQTKRQVHLQNDAAKPDRSNPFRLFCAYTK